MVCCPKYEEGVCIAGGGTGLTGRHALVFIWAKLAVLSVPWEDTVMSHVLLLVPFQLVSLSFQALLYFQSNITCSFIRKCKVRRMSSTWLPTWELQANTSCISSVVAIEGEVARLIRISRSVINEL